MAAQMEFRRSLPFLLFYYSEEQAYRLVHKIVSPGQI